MSPRDQAKQVIEGLGILVELIDVPEHFVGDIRLVAIPRTYKSFDELYEIRARHGSVWKVYLYKVEVLPRTIVATYAVL